MKHDHLTDHQIFIAIRDTGYDHDLTSTDVRAILDALPEPATDDWQECGFEDIQKGDRFKVEHADWSYEGQVKWIDAEVICYDPRIGLAITPQNIDDMRGITLYRIPAPVQHPDPAEHPVIYVKDCDIVGFIPKIMVWYRDSYVAGRQCVSPERITDWQQIDPAKVVEDDR